jgi:putative acetyltransferase
MTSPKIKKAKLSDLNEILSLFEQTIIHTCKNDYNEDQLRVWMSSSRNRDKWKTSITEEYFIVATNNDKIVGFSSLKNGNYLNFMYVHKNFTKKGIANLMFNHLKEKSKELSDDIITAYVSITAKPFFLKKGFKVDKENRNILNGVEIINYRMTLQKK